MPVSSIGIQAGRVTRNSTFCAGPRRDIDCTWSTSSTRRTSIQSRRECSAWTRTASFAQVAIAIPPPKLCRSSRVPRRTTTVVSVVARAARGSRFSRDTRTTRVVGAGAGTARGAVAAGGAGGAACASASRARPAASTATSSAASVSSVATGASPATAAHAGA